MATYPYGSNTYVPKTTNQLIVDYSRNPRVKLNQYCTYHTVNQEIGYFPKFNPDENDRVDISNDADMAWPDGADAHENYFPEHEFVQYNCQRWRSNFTIGELAFEQAEFDIESRYVDGAAKKLLNRRKNKVLTDLTNASLMTNTATATVASGSGGKWDASDASNVYIQKSINYVVEQMNLNSGGLVEADDIYMILSPNVAHQIGQNPEIRSVVNQSPWSFDLLSGTGMLGGYGLPAKLYGVNVIVEPGMKNTSKKGKTRSASYMLSTSVAFVSRAGGIESSTMSCSNLIFYRDGELRVDIEKDPKKTNRRYIGLVSDHYDHVVVPELGFLLTAVVD